MARKKTVKGTKVGAKKTASASKKSSKKLESLSQTHGKQERKYKPTTLDQIWGDEGLVKYGTHDQEEYEDKIKNMNRTDLHTHASKVGIIPVDNREILETRLIREFCKHVASFRAPLDHNNDHKKNNIDQVSERTKRILSEGR
jgi:hypothetical protein